MTSHMVKDVLFTIMVFAIPITLASRDPENEILDQGKRIRN